MKSLVLMALVLSLLCWTAGCNRSLPPAEQAPIAAAPPEDSGPILSEAEVSRQEEVAKPVTEVQVPQLAGVPSDWALQLLNLRQLQGIAGRLYLPAAQWRQEWPEGLVQLQSPRPETWTHPDAQVAFWSLHRAAQENTLVVVPRVIGKPAEEARTLLKDNGLAAMTLLAEPAERENRQPGAVLDQFPRPPQALGPSSTVLLYVAGSAESE